MKLLRSFLLIPAALFVVAIRLLWRFGIKIKMSNFLSTRIGHFVGNTEVYLCERELKINDMHDGIHIWTHYGEPSSQQIDKMWRRVMRIWPQRFMTLAIIINKCFPGWEKHEIGTNTMDRDSNNLLVKCPYHLKFTREEIARAEATLRKWGIKHGNQWVCLMVRDGAYLPNLSYHAYRDCDVDTYTEAAEMLAERGYHVFRMGVKMAKPFAAKHPRIHDFATNGMYSDLMSTYLGAFCSFCVTTSTGWDAIPQAFRRPMCYTNFVPFEYMNTWLPNSLAIWKHHLKDGKRMTVEEIVKSEAGKFMSIHEFENAGITLQDNSPQEIVAVVHEMSEMISGRAHPGAQKEFWDAFPRSVESVTQMPLHGEIKLRIGTDFLQEQMAYAERENDTGADTSTRRLQAGAV